MIAFYDDQDCTETVTRRGSGWVTYTTTTASCTTMTISNHRYVSAVNYELAPVEPKREMDYLAIRRIEVGRDIRAAQMPVGRVCAPMPRGKLSRWRSLKEKRATPGWLN